jgi:hypothetical protein
MKGYRLLRLRMMTLPVVALGIMLLLSACAGVAIPNTGSTSTPVANGTPTTSSNGTPGTTGTPSPGTTPTQSVFKQGSIDFAGTVKSVNGQMIAVSMPDGRLLNINIGGNAPPTVDQIEKISARANSDGSFTATNLDRADNSDLNKPVKYTGVTTSDVGSDNIIHFNVGTYSFSFTIPGTADLKDFNNNPQSIQNNQPVTVEVQFNGANPTLLKVGNPNSH